jgi:plastocyanin
MPRVRRCLAVALLGTLLLLPAWPAAAQPAKPATKATIDGTPQLKWQPAEVTVAVGGTVTFRIVGATPHPVGSGSAPPKDDGKFDTSGCQLDDMGKDGASCTVTFKKAGSYPYFCQLHYAAGMVGTITVGGGDGAVGPPGHLLGRLGPVRPRRPARPGHAVRLRSLRPPVRPAGTLVCPAASGRTPGVRSGH